MACKFGKRKMLFSLSSSHCNFVTVLSSALQCTQRNLIWERDCSCHHSHAADTYPGLTCPAQPTVWVALLRVCVCWHLSKSGLLKVRSRDQREHPLGAVRNASSGLHHRPLSHTLGWEWQLQGVQMPTQVWEPLVKFIHSILQYGTLAVELQWHCSVRYL